MLATKEKKTEQQLLIWTYHTYLSEDNVLAIQPRGGHGADEELGAVRVFAGISHGQHSWLVVDQLGLRNHG